MQGTRGTGMNSNYRKCLLSSNRIGIKEKGMYKSKAQNAVITQETREHPDIQCRRQCYPQNTELTKHVPPIHPNAWGASAHVPCKGVTTTICERCKQPPGG
ncbi:hypothetical protein, unlikely [Trypanosoma brucei gambiense DAL972]|uniref:Uncharacterized protein n=1 Tax=Trypanosoma brucei gambiense (strain MHOM/CI/86/DAL972) TaxID=679716 RepID=D0A377_TRYB9|nr:hypothetical protein, unlikely [Trypanosoma brucei gambiense DAL972]CBH15721.1 hypothetical protein, unlikely [Trypanosoma brucei gambiense DAL972]|eukprot:XP_011777985.1 hypothetical protein, unlikely [Trypanosoma brucei gambiense DAL972]